jgi:plastocyanin
MPSRSIAVLLLATALCASTADAGVIAGTLWLQPTSEALRGASANATATALTAQRSVTDAVIYIELVPEKVEKKLVSPGGWFRRKPAPRAPRIVQKDQRFVPRVMAVAAGSAVEFKNLDNVYHNAFSVSPARRFDLGKYPPGHSDTVRCNRPGVVNLHCDIHPAELGFLVVTPNHAFSRPDSLGYYTLPKLPPGDYTVRVFHPRLGEIKREVTMPRHGDLTLDLRY